MKVDLAAKPRCISRDACTAKHTYCWVSHKYKYIYFETPKCGSTTLKQTLPDKDMIRYLEKDLVDEYFKFSFVRNPWDRMVSVYYSFFVVVADPVQQKNKLRLVHKLFGKDKMSFREFIESLHRSRNHHWEQCNVFWKGTDLDFVGRFENYSEDLAKIYARLKLPMSKLPHINKTNHKPYTEYYTPHLINIVAREFAGDIERFDYAFDIS